MMTIPDIERILNTTNIRAVTIERSPVSPGRFVARAELDGPGGSCKSTDDDVETALQHALNPVMKAKRNLRGLLG